MKSYLIQFSIIVFALLIGHFIAYKLVHLPCQLEIVIIISLLLFYPILRKPLIGLYAVFIISPFIPYIRRLYYLLYSRPSLDPLIIIGDILLVFILLGLFFEFRERQRENQDIAPYIRMIIIYFCYLLLRSFLFNIRTLSEGIARFKYYGPPALFFLIGTIYAYRIEHLKRFWYITIIIGVLASLYGFVQLYFGYSKSEMIWFQSIDFSTLFIKGVPRPFSIFQAPVVLADYVQLAIIGILMCVSWTNNRLKFLLFFLLPLFVYATLITSVRSSWIGMIITFLLWYIFSWIKGNKQRFGVLAAILIISVGYQFIMETFEFGFNLQTIFPAIIKSVPDQQYFELLVKNRATALYDPFSEYSFISRMRLWMDLIKFSKEPVNAFLGRGVGALKADSLYFTYLAEFGYPGLIFIVGIFVVFILKGFKIIDTSDNNDIVSLARGITIMNIIFSIISITGTHIHYFPGDIYFWFWNGALIQLSTFDKAVPIDAELEESSNPWR